MTRCSAHADQTRRSTTQKDAIGDAQSWARSLLGQDRDMLAQREVLQHEMSPGEQDGAKRGADDRKQAEHPARLPTITAFGNQEFVQPCFTT